MEFCIDLQILQKKILIRVLLPIQVNFTFLPFYLLQSFCYLFHRIYRTSFWYTCWCSGGTSFSYIYMYTCCTDGTPPPTLLHVHIASYIARAPRFSFFWPALVFFQTKFPATHRRESTIVIVLAIYAACSKNLTSVYEPDGVTVRRYFGIDMFRSSSWMVNKAQRGARVYIYGGSYSVYLY